MEDYAGKTVVITGGTSGLGYAFAKILGARGATIVITGRREEKGQQALEKLQAEGISARYIQQDVSNESDWNNLAFAVKSEFGTVDYLFNNAGVMLQPNALMKTSLDDWKWIVDTNLMAMVRRCRFQLRIPNREIASACLPPMKPHTLFSIKLMRDTSISCLTLI